LLLVRHGEAAGNAAGLLLGRTDSPLTDRGRAQAAALSHALGAVQRVITSPLARARHTASLLVPHLPAQVDERWIEIDYGVFEGRALSTVPSTLWAQWRQDPSFRPEGGESLVDVGVRVREACEELRDASSESDADPDGGVVVVSHVSPIKAAVAWALGAGDDLAWRLYLATGSVTRIGWGADGPVLRAYNETAYADPRTARPG
jgi:probable phosphoglycerate mutase